MAKDVARAGGPVESMRAADSDRQQIADRLKAALDEGRLSLHEYDDRIRDAYGARTYSELLVLVADLPKAGMSAAEVNAARAREARKMPMALIVLWTIYGSILAVNLMVWALVAWTVDNNTYPWPIWLLVPGVALGTVTVGVQRARRQKRRQ